MVPIFDPSKNILSPDRSLKDSLLSLARATLLAAPLVGCSATPDHSVPENDAIVVNDRNKTEFSFTPPHGFVLAGVDYREGRAAPVFSPVMSCSTPLTETEIAVLHRLLSHDAGLRYSALSELQESYLPRLEPAIVAILFNEPESAITERASRLLQTKATPAALGILCREINVVRGRDLERAIEILRRHPNDEVVRAIFRAIRTSGFGEKEGRDEGMLLGKALASMSPLGEELLHGLLTDSEPTMQMAAAVSLATRSDPVALPILLRHSTGDDFNLRGEAIGALPEYPDRPEILPPLARALKEPEFAFGALFALKEIGYPALAVLEPYAEVEFFKASGVERQGRNPYLPGLSYGEVVLAIARCHELRPSDAGPEGDSIMARILEQGVPKLIADLEHAQLSPGACEGFQALGERAHRHLAGLVNQPSARPLLLSYPTEVLTSEFSPFLTPTTFSPITLDACAILAQSVRRSINPAQRQRALETVLQAYPEAPWLRHFVSSVWREDCDQTWARAALQSVEPAASVCDIATEVDAATALGIEVPLRWSRENLAEIIKNRTALDFDGRPIATIIYAEADYNGAFGEHNSTVDLLRNSGYCIMYYDESTDLGVLRALKAAATRPGATTIEPAALIILGAHSSKTEMVFGRSSSDEARIGLTDKPVYLEAAIGGTLRENGQVVLIACSAGEGRDKETNVANLFRQLFPHAKPNGIWSTEVPDNIRGISLDPVTHELNDVRFIRGRVYRP